MNKILFLFLFLIQGVLLQGQEGSVVCLHGFFRSYRCMIPMGNTMRDEGLRVYLWEYRGRNKTIEEHAACLVEVLNAIALQFPNQPIHFVTHSLGGLIVRSAINHPQCPREAKCGGAVLLAPPNKGAVLARHFKGCPVIRWFFGKHAGRQLMTYREEDICKLGEFPPEMDVMVVAGSKQSPIFQPIIKVPNDGKVTIEETKLDTPHTHRTLYVSHSWIMTSRESMALTKQFLLNRDQKALADPLAEPQID